MTPIQQNPPAPTEVRSRSRRPLPVAAASALIVVAGFTVGIGTQMLQGVLPDSWGVLANSGVMWALTAFALGTLMPSLRWAIAGGAIQLVIASTTYYMAVGWFEGINSNSRGAIIWSIAGILAGSLFGSAGHVCISTPNWRPQTLALVAGTLIGEGIHLGVFVGNPDLRPAGALELIAGSALAIGFVTRPTPHHPAHAKLISTGILAAAATFVLLAVHVINAAFANV